MWRILLSIGMMFGGMAFAAFAVIIIFLIVPSLWEGIFGPTGGAIAALAALGGAIWCAGKIMGFGDRLIGARERDKVDNQLDEIEPSTAGNWPEYNASIVRNKRWAFYRRTRQFDRLAELENEGRREARE
jgi:hypothetical protein